MLKQSRPSSTSSIISFKAYPPDRRLCIYTVLKEYLLRTKMMRGNDQGRLLISNETLQICKQRQNFTMAKAIMQKSGIDVNKYGSHSVRTAATSKANEEP